MEIRLLDEAIGDILGVAQEYEQLRVGLGETIMDEVDEKLAYLREHPFGYQVVGAGIRRAPLSVVPYQLFYAVVDNQVLILGLADGRTEPSHRLSRMQARKGA